MHLYQPLEIDPLSEHSNLMRAHLSNLHSIVIGIRGPVHLTVNQLSPTQINKEIQILLLKGNSRECLTFINDLPYSHFQIYPILYIYQALAITFGDFSVAEIEKLLVKTEELGGNQNLYGEITAVRALMRSFTGDPDQGIELSHEALTKIPPGKVFFRILLARNLGLAYMIKGKFCESAKWFETLLLSSHKLGDHYGILSAYHYLTYIRKLQGRLNEAAIMYHKALSYIADNALEDLPRSIKIIGGYGHLWIQRHEIERAKSFLRKAIGLAKDTDILLAQRAYLDLSEVFIRENDLRSALANIQECRQHLQRKSSDYFKLINQCLLATEARIHLEAGRVEEAYDWLISSGFEGKPANELYNEFGIQLGYLLPIAVRICLAKDQEERALDILNFTLPKYLQAGATTYLIRGLNALAITYHQMGRMPKAIKALVKAIDLAKPEGNLGDFVFIGRDIIPLLYEIVQSGIETDFCGKLLTILSNLAKPGSASANLLKMVDPLSNRELDVLRLIARGMTNREIAGNLFLSANTVKSHSIKIYRKLNVNNRSQAVSKAQLLGILPSKFSSTIQASI